jgi:hypothetical protein
MLTFIFVRVCVLCVSVCVHFYYLFIHFFATVLYCYCTCTTLYFLHFEKYPVILRACWRIVLIYSCFLFFAEWQQQWLQAALRLQTSQGKQHGRLFPAWSDGYPPFHHVVYCGVFPTSGVGGGTRVKERNLPSLLLFPLIVQRSERPRQSAATSASLPQRSSCVRHRMGTGKFRYLFNYCTEKITLT